MLSHDWLLLLKDSSFTSAKCDPPARIRANLRTLQMTLSRQLQLFSFFPWDTLWAWECFTHHNALFSDQLHPLTFISSLLPSLLNWGFQVTSHPSKLFYHKITWYKSCSQDHSVHTLFFILFHSWSKTTPCARWTFCLIYHSWSHTLTTLHNLFSPFPKTEYSFFKT